MLNRGGLVGGHHRRLVAMLRSVRAGPASKSNEEKDEREPESGRLVHVRWFR